MDYLKKVLLDVFDLNADRASMEEISERIESGALLKGTNYGYFNFSYVYCFYWLEYE